APLFVKDHLTQPEPIPSMPGIFRFSPAQLLDECRQLRDLGIPAVALFPCMPPDSKDPEGSAALNPDNLICRTVRTLKEALPDLTLITDVALDPYTSHGHDGVLGPDGLVDNDRTVDLLAHMALLLARVGADIVAPSDMMDGRVHAIRRCLEEAGSSHTIILAYAAKFASAYYGPFRDAVGSAQAAGTHTLDKRSYQLDPANAREAEREVDLDAAEGADILMVKPAGPYLDIIRRVRQRSTLPVAAYQVSGEYAQIHAAAERGWLNLTAARDESLLAIKRAGADLILTYFAKDIARDLTAP
ncbi:MAG: porphobilinogen synthase, partial [Verrucomicrobiia bacterium]